MSTILAALTYKYVENPIRNHPALKSSAMKSLGIGLTLSIVVAIFAIGLSMTNFRHLTDRPIVSVPTPTSVDVNNSAVINELIFNLSPKLTTSDLSPVSLETVENAVRDDPITNDNGCHTEEGTDFLPDNCYFAKESGINLIVLFGNSHANQFFSALENAANDLDLRLLHRTRSGCSVADVTTTRGGTPWDSCNQWRTAAVEEMVKLKPAVVVMVGGLTVSGVIDPNTGNAATEERKQELTIFGLRSTVKSLTDAGIKVIFIRDTPNLFANPVDCLAARTVESCVQPMNGALESTETSTGAVQNMTNVTPVDLTLALCQISTCAPVRGGIVVWRDDHHLTNSYSKELAPLFKSLIEPLLVPNSATIP